MNEYIRDAISRKLSVKVITLNGYQMCCTIVSQDDTCVIVNVGNRKKMVYKHAISTIEAA